MGQICSPIINHKTKSCSHVFYLFISRSRPIVMVRASVRFNPTQIPTQNSECTKPLASTAEICFTMSSSTVTTGSFFFCCSSITTIQVYMTNLYILFITAQAKISYTFTLDATRKVPNNRAYISEKQREMTGLKTISLEQQQCFTVNFFIDVSCSKLTATHRV